MYLRSDSFLAKALYLPWRHLTSTKALNAYCQAAASIGAGDGINASKLKIQVWQLDLQVSALVGEVSKQKRTSRQGRRSGGGISRGLASDL